MTQFQKLRFFSVFPSKCVIFQCLPMTLKKNFTTSITKFFKPKSSLENGEAIRSVRYLWCLADWNVSFQAQEALAQVFLRILRCHIPHQRKSSDSLRTNEISLCSVELRVWHLQRKVWAEVRPPQTQENPHQKPVCLQKVRFNFWYFQETESSPITSRWQECQLFR